MMLCGLLANRHFGNIIMQVASNIVAHRPSFPLYTRLLHMVGLELQLPYMIFINLTIFFLRYVIFPSLYYTFNFVIIIVKQPATQCRRPDLITSFVCVCWQAYTTTSHGGICVKWMLFNLDVAILSSFCIYHGCICRI